MTIFEVMLRLAVVYAGLVVVLFLLMFVGVAIADCVRAWRIGGEA